jgi:hypothetical protein
MTPTRSTCRYCRLRREHTYPVARTGGGTFRRAGRSYVGATCLSCVEGALRRATPHTYADGTVGLQLHNQWSVHGLLGALEHFIALGVADLDEARWARQYAADGHHFIPFDGWYAALVQSITRLQSSRAERAEKFAQLRTQQEGRA